MKKQTFLVLLVIIYVVSCKKEDTTLSSSTQTTPASVSFASANIINGSAIVNSSLFVKGIDNCYFPLLPGTTFKYKNTIKDNGEVTIEHITVNVTHNIKTILGVNCEVVHDYVKVNGKLTEDTYDWYAQDKLGNIWYFGEDTKSYEDGEADSSGSFEAGVDGALPGIIMFAHPALFLGITYNQEYYKGEAEDKAKVFDLHETAVVAYGTFNNCLVTKEFTPLEPGDIEYKFYAPGTGQVLTISNSNEREELISITHE